MCTYFLSCKTSLSNQTSGISKPHYKIQLFTNAYKWNFHSCFTILSEVLTRKDYCISSQYIAIHNPVYISILGCLLIRDYTFKCIYIHVYLYLSIKPSIVEYIRTCKLCIYWYKRLFLYKYLKN